MAETPSPEPKPLSDIGFEIPVFKARRDEVIAQAQANGQEIDEYHLRGDLSREILEGALLPALAQRFTEGRVNPLWDRFRAVEAIQDPITRTEESKKMYQMVLDQVISNDGSTWIDKTSRFAEELVSLDGSETTGLPTLKNFDKLMEYASGNAPTSLIASSAAKATKLGQSGLTGFEAMVAAQNGRPESQVQYLLKLSGKQKEDAEKIPIPKEFEDAGFLDTALSPQYVLAQAAKNYPSMVGMAASAVNPIVGATAIATYYGTTSAGAKYEEIYPDILEAVGGDVEEARKMAASVATTAGVIEGGTETLSNAIQLKALSPLVKAAFKSTGVDKVVLKTALSKPAVAFGAMKTSLLTATKGALAPVSTEVAEELVGQHAESMFTYAILEKHVTGAEDRLKGIKETLGADSPAAKKLEKSIKALKTAGDWRNLDTMRIISEAAKGALPFAFIGGGAGGVKGYKQSKQGLSSEDAEIINMTEQVNINLKEKLNAIDKGLGTKAKKAEKREAAVAEANNLVAFRIGLKERVPDASLADIGDDIKSIEDTFNRSTATTEEKGVAMDKFTKIFGEGTDALTNYQVFGYMGADLLSEQGETSVKQREEISKRLGVELASRSFSEQQKTKRDTSEKLKETAKKSVVEAIEDNNKIDTAVGDLDAMAADVLQNGGTRDEVKDVLAESIVEGSDEFVKDLAKAKFQDSNLRTIIREIQGEKKEVAKTDADTTKEVDKAIQSLSKSSKGLEGLGKQKLEALEQIKTMIVPSTSVEGAALQNEMIKEEVLVIQQSISKDALNKRKETMIESINAIEASVMENIGVPSLADYAGDITQGKALEDLDIGELMQVKSRFSAQKARLTAQDKFQRGLQEVIDILEPVGNAPAALELRAEAVDAPLASIADLKKRATALWNEYKSANVNYEPDADLAKLKVTTTPELRNTVDGALDRKSLGEMKKLRKDLDSILGKIRLSNNRSGKISDIRSTIEQGVLALDTQIAKSTSDMGVIKNIESSVANARRTLNHLALKLDDPSIQSKAQELGVELPDVDTLNKDITEIRDLLSDMDATNPEPIKADEQYRDIMSRIGAIMDKYNGLIKADTAVKADERAQTATEGQSVTGSPTVEGATDDANTTIQSTIDAIAGNKTLREQWGKLVSENETLLSDPTLSRLNTLMRRMFLHSAPVRETKIAKQFREMFLRNSFSDTLKAGISEIEKTIQTGQLTQEAARLFQAQLESHKIRLADIQAKKDKIMVKAKRILASKSPRDQRDLGQITRSLVLEEIVDAKDPTPYLEVYKDHHGFRTGSKTDNGIDHSDNFIQIADYLPSSYLSSLRPMELEGLVAPLTANAARLPAGVPQKARYEKLLDYISKEMEDRKDRFKRREGSKNLEPQTVADTMMRELSAAARILTDIELVSDSASKRQLTNHLDTFFVLRDVLASGGTALNGLGISKANEMASMAIVDNAMLGEFEPVEGTLETDSTDGESQFSIPGKKSNHTSLTAKVQQVNEMGVTEKEQTLVDNFNKLRDQISGFNVDDIRLVDRPSGVPAGSDGRVVNAGTPDAHVEIYRDAIESVDDLARVMRHESFGHRFLPAILGRKLWRKLERYVKHHGGLGGDSISTIAQRYKDEGVTLSQKRAIYEAIAFHGEVQSNTTPLPLWKNVFRSMSVTFKSLTGMDLSEGDVQYLFRSAYRKFTVNASAYKQAVKEGAGLWDGISRETKREAESGLRDITDMYAIRDRFIRDTERSIIKLGGPAASGQSVESFIDDVGGYFAKEHGLTNGVVNYRRFLEGYESPEVDALIAAKPELGATLRGAKISYQRAYGESVSVEERAAVNKARSSGASPTDIKNIRDTYSNLKSEAFRRLTSVWKYTNDLAGVMGFTFTTGKEVMTYHDPITGEAKGGLIDPELDVVSAMRRDRSSMTIAALGLNHRGTVSGMVGANDTRIVTKDSNGKTRVELIPERISDKDLTSRIAPFLSLGEDTAKASEDLSSYLESHRIVTERKDVSMERIAKANQELARLDKKYKRLGTNPMEQILEFYTDLSYLMESSGKFTREEVMNMRYRRTLHVSPMKDGARKMLGKGDAPKSPMASIVAETTTITKRAGKADAHRKLTNMVDRFMQSDNYEYRLTFEKMTDAQLKNHLGDANERDLMTPIAERIRKFNEEGKEEWIYRYRSDGEMHTLLVRDKNFFDSLVSYEEAGSGQAVQLETIFGATMAMRSMQSIARVKRAMVTKFNITFSLTNLVKDAMTNYMSGYVDLGGYPKYFTSEFKSYMDDQIFLSGAMEASENLGQLDKFAALTDKGPQAIIDIVEAQGKKNKGFGKRAKNAWKGINGAFDFFLDHSESMGRYAVADSFLTRHMDFINEEGISEAERDRRAEAVHANAFDKTRDVLNFAQKGKNKYFNQMLQFSSFARVGLTATERSVRAVLEAIADPTIARRALPRTLGVLGGMTALMYLMNRDDEEYKYLRESDKLRNFHYRMGDGFAVVPKPFNLPGLFANAVQSALTFWDEKDPVLAKTMAEDLISNLIPNLPYVRGAAQAVGSALGVDLNPSMKMMPDLADMFYQIGRNEDFFRGGKIVPEHILQKGRRFQYDDGNTEGAKTMTRMGLGAADVWEFAMTQTMGYWTLQTLQYFEDMGSPVGVKFIDSPVTKRFFMKDTSAKQANLSWFYDYRADLQQKSRDIRQLKEEERYTGADIVRQKALIHDIVGDDPHFERKLAAMSRAYRRIKSIGKRLEKTEDWDKLPNAAKAEMKTGIYDVAKDLRQQVRQYDSP